MIGRRVFVLLAVTVSLAGIAVAGWKADPKLAAQSRPGRNYDESKVPSYTLPDPLVCEDGTKVRSERMWRQKRRPEVLDLFREHVYGRTPLPIEGSKKITHNVFESSDNALNGKARRRQVRVNFTGSKDGPGMDVLMYLPRKAEGKTPVLVLLNFQGNHAVSTDPAIRLSDSWMRPGREGVKDNRATEAARGKAAKRFPIEAILKRGYGVATIYYGDIDPDYHDGFENGVHGLFDPEDGRTADSWGSIAAWAWGLSKAMDYFETDADVDAERVIVLGHSRLGKTSLWAGAQDQRFAMVISNDSGCGGAALSRRAYGETVKRINTSFPHWFCDNFKKYNDNEGACPVDQHMLIALMAPRPVYVASADRDLWADPRGEFLSARHAGGVYRLFGLTGLGVEQMPDLDSPVQKGRIGYHVRSGGHDLTEYDWQRYMDFADKHLRGQ